MVRIVEIVKIEVPTMEEGIGDVVRFWWWGEEGVEGVNGGLLNLSCSLIYGVYELV